MNEKKSLIFFGSGPVAAESLRLLMQSFSIEAVITKPTTEKEMKAISGDTPLLTVSNKAELDVLFTEHKFSSKLGVLIDFGIIVSSKIIDYFEFGIINSHFSLLPELRGADPISFAILEGKEKTGVSLMMLVEAMDEGPLLDVTEVKLTQKETTPELTSNLIKVSYDLLVDTIPKYLNNSIQPTPQNSDSSYTRKLTKADGVIDWSKSAEQIEREIRAYIEWPKSRTKLGDVECVITKACVVPVNTPNSKPGDVEVIPETKSIKIECGKDSLYIEKLKPAGKQEMTTEGFLAGYKDRIINN